MNNVHPLKDSKLLLCRYSVENLILMVGEENISLDHSNVLSIEYLNDYEFNIRALLKISLRIDVRRRLWILKNKRSITAKLEVIKFGMDIESEQAITTPETLWNQEFAIYFPDEEEATDTGVTEQRIDINEGGAYSSTDTSSENLFEADNLIDLYLFDQKFLDASNTTYNEVFTKNILQTCVARLLTATKHDRVVMSPFENDEEYEELLCPAGPAYKSLIYLDQYYGFYKTGAIIYYDIDTLYILNSNGKLTAKKEGEYPTTVFYVTALDYSTPGNGMFRREGENCFYCSINEMNINSQKFADNNNEIKGTEAKYVISDDINMDLSSANQSYTKQRNERIAYTKKDDNKFIANIVRARREENEIVLYITGENLDISAFTPNKEYQICFDQTSKQLKYADYIYRISYSYHMLKPESDQYMVSSHRIVLKKRAEDGEITKLNNDSHLPSGPGYGRI